MYLSDYSSQLLLPKSHKLLNEPWISNRIMSSKVLRIQRADSAEDFVLIKASPSGKHALDLDLLATEGSSPYVGKGASLRANLIFNQLD